MSCILFKIYELGNGNFASQAMILTCLHFHHKNWTTKKQRGRITGERPPGKLKVQPKTDSKNKFKNEEKSNDSLKQEMYYQKCNKIE